MNNQCQYKNQNEDQYEDQDDRRQYYRRRLHKAHTYSTMYSVFHTIIMFFALYLSFKCNNGFLLFDFLFACCCPVLYILYRGITSPNFCNAFTNLPAKV